MARGQITKRLARAHAAFKQAVTAYIVSKGARRVDQFYDFEIDTPAGLLGISVWDDAIMTRFSDVGRGKSLHVRRRSVVQSVQRQMELPLRQ